MKIRHLIIDDDSKTNSDVKVYIVKNTSNGQYVRLGKTETHYLLFRLGEHGYASELNSGDNKIQELSAESKDLLETKFNEWGFLDESQTKIKQNSFESLKKIHLIKFNVEKVIKTIYPIYSIFFTKVWLALLIVLSSATIGYFIYSAFAFDVNGSEFVLNLNSAQIVIIVLIFIFNTFLHEFAHAVTCVKYGGKVISMGLMLFYLFPCFYCDVSDVYSIKDRKKRAIVATSGILTNLFFGFLLLFTSIILSFFNIVEVSLYYSAISLIIFAIYNLLPFVKMDGYWLISSLSGIDNLMDKSVVLAYTLILSPKKLKLIKMKLSKKILLSVYGVICFFFHSFFWLYSFIAIDNLFNLSGIWRIILFSFFAVLFLTDLIKNIIYYLNIIKNHYDRYIFLINENENQQVQTKL